MLFLRLLFLTLKILAPVQNPMCDFSGLTPGNDEALPSRSHGEEATFPTLSAQTRHCSLLGASAVKGSAPTYASLGQPHLEAFLHPLA